NFLSSTSPVLNELINQAATATALAASSNPGSAGQSIVLTATVNALTPVPGFGQPSGTVLFQDGSKPLGEAFLNNGAATLTVTLGAGNHTLSALYEGSTPFQSSASSAVAETVNNPAPVVTGIIPATLPEGSPTFTLTVNGSPFQTGVTVQWNG